MFGNQANNAFITSMSYEDTELVLLEMMVNFSVIEFVIRC